MNFRIVIKIMSFSVYDTFAHQLFRFVSEGNKSHLFTTALDCGIAPGFRLPQKLKVKMSIMDVEKKQHDDTRARAENRTLDKL